MSEKVVAMTPRNAGRKLSTIVAIANSYFKGWSQYFKVIDAKDEVERFMANTDAHMRRRLRAILLKQWKRKRVRLNKLVSPGVSKRAAGRAEYEQSRSLWPPSLPHLRYIALCQTASLLRLGLLHSKTSGSGSTQSSYQYS